MKIQHRLNHLLTYVKIITLLSLINIPSYAQVANPVAIPGDNPADKPWITTGSVKNEEWHGFKIYESQIDEFRIWIAEPKTPAKGKPWIMRIQDFGDGFHWQINEKLLNSGAYVVAINSYNLYGADYGLNLMDSLYNIARRHFGLPEKCGLSGVSRAALSAYRWAIRHPERVACIYCEGPVLDFKTWPMSWPSSAGDWTALKRHYGFTSDAEAVAYKGNPIDHLEPIAKAKIPIRHVISLTEEHDTKIVPNEKNTLKARQYLQRMGHDMEIAVIPEGMGVPYVFDDESVEFVVSNTKEKIGVADQINPEPIVDFILRHQSKYEKYLHYNVRGSLKNSFVKFEKERKARVAFLGGSITEMNGWKNMIEKQLQQRFPYTQFEFVEAGIASTGTTPGAFRLQNDILSKGKMDLLFVEAAVNDHTNGFSAKEQIRGMEGEVRHALMSNPEMDIVMLHFIYDPFIPMIAKKQQPDVILNHERVANHYLIPSVNLVQEICERMQEDEFTWEQFGGTHPSPFGHTYYAAAINHLLDAMWKGVTPDKAVAPHEIPEQPLDMYSYYKGDFIDLREAKLNKGWKYVASWRPDDTYEKRSGFVDIPMLEAAQPGDRLTLDFKGKAIGIFCTPGPAAGIIEYSVDGAPFKKLDTFTQWSKQLYIPWVYMMETELSDTKHQLVLKISRDKNAASEGYQCQIRNFVVNR